MRIRKSRLCLTVLMLVASLTAPVAAAGEAEALSGFCQNGVLNAFVSLREWPEEFVAKARMGDLQRYLSAEGEPEKQADSTMPTSYLLLLDSSTSMGGLRRQMERFTSELLDAGRDTDTYAVATLGDHFQLLQTYTTDKHSAQRAVEKIRYGAQRTDLAGGVLAALDYLEQRERAAGELVNLILMTDGVPEKAEDGPALEEAVQRAAASPSVLLHTFGLGTGRAESPAALDTLATLGRGGHPVLEWGSGAAARAADEITTLVEGLCVLRFPFPKDNTHQTTDMAIYFFTTEDGEEQLLYRAALDAVPTLDQIGADAPPSGGDNGQPIAPGAVSPLELPSSPAPAEPSPGGVASPLPSGSAAPLETSSGAAPNPSDGQSEKKGAVPGWVFALAACLAAAGGIGFLLYRRGHSARREPPSVGAIFMRLEVFSGQCITKGREFYLTDELLIGRSRSCDLVWRNQELSPRSARIFLRDHVVYLEDLDSKCGTSLGGMRLHSPNRLRSGDEIALGSVRFQFKF